VIPSKSKVSNQPTNPFIMPSLTTVSVKSVLKQLPLKLSYSRSISKIGKLDEYISSGCKTSILAIYEEFLPTDDRFNPL
jgi:hypothetical protein